MCKHTPELAQLIVNAGGVAAMVDYVNNSKDNNRMPGVMALGYIAAFNDRLGMAVIASQGVPSLALALKEESNEQLQVCDADVVALSLLRDGA